MSKMIDFCNLIYKVCKLFYIDYVVGLHNIHVLYVLNYTVDIIDNLTTSIFLSSTKKRFPTHFRGYCQTQEN